MSIYHMWNVAGKEANPFIQNSTELFNALGFVLKFSLKLIERINTKYVCIETCTLDPSGL